MLSVAPVQGRAGPGSGAFVPVVRGVVVEHLSAREARSPPHAVEHLSAEEARWPRPPIRPLRGGGLINKGGPSVLNGREASL